MIFRKGYKKSYKYDIARDLDDPTKTLDHLSRRITDFYSNPKDLTKAGKERMDKINSEIKKLSRKLKSFAKAIRKEAN